MDRERCWTNSGWIEDEAATQPLTDFRREEEEEKREWKRRMRIRIMMRVRHTWRGSLASAKQTKETREREMFSNAAGRLGLGCTRLINKFSISLFKGEHNALGGSIEISWRDDMMMAPPSLLAVVVVVIHFMRYRARVFRFTLWCTILLYNRSWSWSCRGWRGEAAKKRLVRLTGHGESHRTQTASVVQYWGVVGDGAADDNTSPGWLNIAPAIYLRSRSSAAYWWELSKRIAERARRLLGGGELSCCRPAALSVHRRVLVLNKTLMKLAAYRLSSKGFHPAPLLCSWQLCFPAV